MIRVLTIAAALIAVVLLPGAGARADFATGNAAYLKGDYATALAELRPQAERGNTHAQFLMGEMYLHGQGVERDFAQAASWYDQAARYGHTSAQVSLGALNTLGLGVERNLHLGYFWMVMSALWENGDLRQVGMQAFGDVSEQITPELKKQIAEQGVRQWRRGN